MLRVEFHDQLDAANALSARLFAWSRELLRAAAQSFEQGDAKSAARVLSDDTIFDAARTLRTSCIDLLWKQQPLADELRLVAAMLEMAPDFERIAFNERELAKHAMRVIELGDRPNLSQFQSMVEEVDAMLDEAAQSFRGQNIPLAESVIERSDALDRLNEEGLQQLQAETSKNKALVASATSELLAMGALKRVGDHVENLAWHIKAMA